MIDEEFGKVESGEKRMGSDFLEFWEGDGDIVFLEGLDHFLVALVSDLGEVLDGVEECGVLDIEEVTEDMDFCEWVAG